MLADAVETATGPLLVEIDKANGTALGISVTSTMYKGNSVICVQSIQPASIADRSEFESFWLLAATTVFRSLGGTVCLLPVLTYVYVS